MFPFKKKPILPINAPFLDTVDWAGEYKRRWQDLCAELHMKDIVIDGLKREVGELTAENTRLIGRIRPRHIDRLGCPSVRGGSTCELIDRIVKDSGDELIKIKWKNTELCVRNERLQKENARLKKENDGFRNDGVPLDQLVVMERYLREHRVLDKTLLGVANESLSQENQRLRGEVSLLRDIIEIADDAPPDAEDGN
jgi:hypothetical protein